MELQTAVGLTLAFITFIYQHVWKCHISPIIWFVFIYSYWFCWAHMLVLWMINAFVICKAAFVSQLSSFKWKTGFHLWWTYEGSWQVLVGSEAWPANKTQTGFPPFHSLWPLLCLLPPLFSSYLRTVSVLFKLYLETCISMSSDVNMNYSSPSTNISVEYEAEASSSNF